MAFSDLLWDAPRLRISLGNFYIAVIMFMISVNLYFMLKRTVYIFLKQKFCEWLKRRQQTKAALKALEEIEKQKPGEVRLSESNQPNDEEAPAEKVEVVDSEMAEAREYPPKELLISEAGYENFIPPISPRT